jgi:hypothetical protein
MIPTDLSERNYTFDNWKAMVLAMAKIRVAAEKGAARSGDEALKNILDVVQKLEKETGIKYV